MIGEGKGKEREEREDRRGKAKHFICTTGTKQPNLERLIDQLRGESDKVANEIYTWIDHHKKGFETLKKSRDQPHDQSRDQSTVAVKEGKKDVEYLIKNLKGESDHLANELYSWIDEHTKWMKSHDQARDQARDHIVHKRDDAVGQARGHARDLSRGQSRDVHKRDTVGQARGHARDLSRGLSRDHSRSKRDVKDSSDGLEGDQARDQARDHLLKRDDTVGQARGHARDLSRGQSRDHSRSKRDVKDSSDGLEGESIQDVMKDLMNAPHQEKQRENHDKKKSVKMFKRKANRKKTRKTLTKKSKKRKTVPKTLKKQNIKNVKRIQKSKTTNRSKVLKPKKRPTAHAHKLQPKKFALPDLLKAIAADPAKRIVVTNKGEDVKIVKKSLKIINQIPKSVLKKLLKNMNLGKYFRMANYLSGKIKKGKMTILKRVVKSEKKGKRMKVIKKIQTVKAKKGLKVVPKSGTKNRKVTRSKPAKDAGKTANIAKKKKIVKPKKFASKFTKKIPVNKKAKSKIISKPKVLKKDKLSAKQLKSHSALAYEKLSSLKQKIKKTNSLKFKVAQALLAHCETQNKLKRIFDNVNASLKEASQLAKAIGKKFGVKQADIDRLSTEHTQEAVAEFLDHIF
ncbi:hypothetical protein QZH41_012263 [Actinostola sp. cb2023]|nr:hypothetical protein QZH41_012263 [Actinostola sp. cb2023]